MASVPVRIEKYVKNERKEKSFWARTWQPARPFPTPFVALHRRWAVRGRWDGVNACEG
jgi:hypothetical protein